MYCQRNERSAQIKERIQAANSAYWKYRKYLKDYHISKTTKNPRIFERKIVGPRRTEEGDYRVLMNYEIKNLTEGEEIVGFVKTQRLRWFGHIQRRNTIRKIMHWRPVEERPRSRPRIRWEDQIHEDVRRIGIEDWRSKIQDRKTWAKTIREARHKREDQGGVIHRKNGKKTPQQG
jgi:hypothetical protein